MIKPMITVLYLDKIKAYLFLKVDALLNRYSVIICAMYYINIRFLFLGK